MSRVGVDRRGNRAQTDSLRKQSETRMKFGILGIRLGAAGRALLATAIVTAAMIAPAGAQPARLDRKSVV